MSAYSVIRSKLALFMLALSLVLAGCTTLRGQLGRGYDAYVIGDTAAATPGQVQPGALLMGGGDWPYPAFRWFFARAGGGHLVILRASYGPENQEEMYRQIGGLTSIRTFVIHHRKAAFAPEILQAVTHADGIFFGGGDQAKYITRWQGTPLQDALNRHVAMGKPIGGTSAGLAVLGYAAYGALDGNSLESSTALQDADTSQLTMAEDFLVVPPLHAAGVVTDTHFSERDRQGRLLAMLDLLQRRHPGRAWLGLGVDENTALCLTPEGGEIMSLDDGNAWLFRPGAPAPRKGNALQIAGWQVEGINRHSKLVIAADGAWQVVRPAFQAQVDVRDGVIRYTPALRAAGE